MKRIWFVLCVCLLVFGFKTTSYAADIFIDDVKLDMKNQTTLTRDGYTFIPFRLIFENLGAEVDWDATSRTITADVADLRIVMKLDSTTATVNGKEITMEVAPVAVGGSTYVPLRYIAEFCKQKVDWDSKTQTIRISPDYQGTRELVWFINSMNANMIVREKLAYNYPGGVVRSAYNVQFSRERLYSGWGIHDREGVLNTIKALYGGMHNAAYLQQNGTNGKWGETGILAWDYCRISQIAGWAYVGGYISLDEYVEVCLPAAETVQKSFTGWEEMDLNFVEGAAFWLHEDMQNPGKELLLRINAHKQFVAEYQDKCPPWNMKLEISAKQDFKADTSTPESSPMMDIEVNYLKEIGRLLGDFGDAGQKFNSTINLSEPSGHWWTDDTKTYLALMEKSAKDMLALKAPTERLKKMESYSNSMAQCHADACRLFREAIEKDDVNKLLEAVLALQKSHDYDEPMEKEFMAFHMN